MCGIFGIFSKKKLSSHDQEVLKRSKEYLNHRGPDQFNIVKVNENLSLAHTRLSIIDLSDKNYQPRSDGNHTICFNGEIYNFKELKEKYLHGESFITTGDTEVLLKMWKKFGKDCLKYLDGMFSIAIWDDKKLYLATDHFGEKPLFIYEEKSKIYFSSEPNIFFDLLNPSLELKETPFFDFLGIQINEESISKEIKKISHGSIVEILNGKILSNKKYLKKKSIINKEKEINELTNQNLDEIMDLLIKSIRKRLISDQKISILQSGGYDSTLLLAVIKNELKLDFQCYHLEQDGFSEKTQIINNFKKLNIDTKYIKFVQFDENNLDINNIIKYHHQLTDNFSIGLVDSICKNIYQDNIRVALSGTGGDELFYGYTKYYNAYQLQNKTKYLKNKFFKNIFKFLPSENIFNLINNNSLEIISYLKNQNNYRFVKKNQDLNLLTENYFSNNNLFENMRDFDLNFTMPDNINFNQDIASMRNSVEIRCPFLNAEIFNYVEKINPKLLFLKGPKTISKMILDKYFKLDIVKTGFSFSDNMKKKFRRINSSNIEKYKLSEHFNYNFQLGFKQLYKKSLMNKFHILEQV